VSVIIAIVLAFRGASYWALVAMYISETLVKAALTMTGANWLPRLPRRGTGIRDMVKFGIDVSGFNLLTYIGRNADNILIGRFLGAAATGIYSKAYSILMMPLIHVNAPLNSVAIPVLSRLQNDEKRYKEFYYRAVAIVAYLTGPLVVLLAVVAEPLVLTVLGRQWREAAEVFQLLAGAALVQPLLYTCGWIWLSMGRTRDLFRWSLITAPATTLSFVAGLPWGVKGVAFCYMVCSILLLPVGLLWAFRGTELRVRQLIRVVWRPYWIASLVFIVSSLGMRYLRTGSPLVDLVSICGVSGAAAIAFALVQPGVRSDVLGIVKLVRRSLRPA
jgi:PST family polysaccharide transporter